jgi:hypothetical protein
METYRAGNLVRVLSVQALVKLPSFLGYGGFGGKRSLLFRGMESIHENHWDACGKIFEVTGIDSEGNLYLRDHIKIWSPEYVQYFGRISEENYLVAAEDKIRSEIYGELNCGR